jgi:hypothetical protein
MIDQSIIKASSIALFVFAWTLFGITNNANVFFPLLAVCCFAFYSGMMLPVKYRDFDDRVNIVGFLYTFSNLLDEFVFDPKKIQANEYVFAAIIIIFVIYGRGRKKEKIY